MSGYYIEETEKLRKLDEMLGRVETLIAKVDALAARMGSVTAQRTINDSVNPDPPGMARKEPVEL